MMEEKQDNQNNQEEQATLTVGATLREVRERQGLSVSDVVNRLKFAPRQIQALEEDDYAQLPEAAFVRGLVRSYARLLQLDEKPLLEALPGAKEQKNVLDQRQTMEVPFPNVYALRKSNILWLVAALVVAVALGLFAWLHDREPRPVQTHAGQSETVPLAIPEMPVSAVEAASAAVAATPVDEPVEAEPAAKPVEAAPKPKPKPAAATAPGMIRITFDEDSWVEVKDKDGQVLLSVIGTAGSEQNVNGTPPFAVTVGHASGVRLYYKGSQVDMAPNTRAEVAHLTLE